MAAISGKYLLKNFLTKLPHKTHQGTHQGTHHQSTGECKTGKGMVLMPFRIGYINLRIINNGYLLGKFRFLDVLESQKTLFRARKNLITSLLEYNILIADIERLIGRPLATISN